MIKKVKFYKRGHAYFGDDVERDGYIGEVDTIPNAITITIIKPNSTLEDVKRSLEITLLDIELRIKQEPPKAEV